VKVRRSWLAFAWLVPVLQAQPVSLEPVVVTAARAPEAPGQVPFSLIVLDGPTLRAAPAATLDDALRAVPGFSLFRRSDSFTANPTTQGVSLRGLGPSGASRSLVLLDGVPLNDPFGGWVEWSKVPRESLASAELVRGGGATAWGNAALGGVVQLLTEPPGASRLRVAATTGDFGTRSVELAVAEPLGAGTLQLSGRDFATDGFNLVAPEDRGPIDTAAWSRHRWLTARWSQPVGDNAEIIFTGRTFTEARGNGTPYQRNSSRENFGSVVWQAQPSKSFAWTATAYAQDQSFASTFSSVNATRTAETPASDQFAVPAVAVGAAWSAVWTDSADARTSFGADLRRVRGETRENFSFASGDFTRQRVAVGAQDFTGLFALQERPLTADLRATFGGRLDFWRETDGHRLETVRASGAILRDDHYAGRDGVEFSPSAGLVWQPAGAWRVRAAAQQSFRRPTLNELYRPFRVGNVITEANPALKTEHATSAELGLDYTQATLTLGAAVFWNELRDAVGNVTVAQGPGTFPLFGFIPAGGTGVQRLNLDRVQVYGTELSVKWQPVPSLTLDASYLNDDTSVQRAAIAPALVGKQLAQVPRNSAAFGANWRGPGGLTLTPRVRWLGPQFEDDQNLLILRAAVVADFNVSYPLTPQLALFLTVENLGDARIETGRSVSGLVNTGTPRLAFAGIRAAW
jgi:outer membrane receptor protein involved in Fe transport